MPTYPSGILLLWFLSDPFSLWDHTYAHIPSCVVSIYVAPGMEESLIASPVTPACCTQQRASSVFQSSSSLSLSFPFLLTCVLIHLSDRPAELLSTPSRPVPLALVLSQSTLCPLFISSHLSLSLLLGRLFLPRSYYHRYSYRSTLPVPILSVCLLLKCWLYIC